MESVASESDYEAREREYLESHQSMRWGATPVGQGDAVVSHTVHLQTPVAPALAATRVLHATARSAVASARCCAVNVNAATCPGVFANPKNFRMTWWGKVYFGAVLLQSVVFVAVSVAVLVDPGPSKAAKIYPVLGLLCVAAFLYFSLDAVRSENRFQFMASMLAGLLITLFVLVSAFSKPDEEELGPVWHRAHVVVVIFSLLFQVLYLGLCKPTLESFGFMAFKVAGADLVLQDLYSVYLAFLSLLKLDLFVSLLLLLMSKFFLLDVDSPGVYLGSITLVLSFLLAGITWFAVTRESKPWVLAFAVLAVYKPAYLAYNLVTYEIKRDLLPEGVTYTQFAVVGTLSFVVRAALCWYTYRMYRGFGKGLRARVFEGTTAKTTALLAAVQ